MHPDVEKELAETRNRAFEKDKTAAQKLMDIMIPVPTPFGVLPGFKMGDERVERFIERVARGMLNKSFNLQFSQLSGYKSDFIAADNEWFYKDLPPAVKRVHKGNTFSYIACRTGEKTYGVMLRFYLRLVFDVSFNYHP